MHQVGELIAAIAVVISLIFVGIQIRENTIASKAATYQDSVAYDVEILLSVGSSPDMSRIFFTFRDNPSALEGDELIQGRTLLTATLRHFENLYLQHEAGMLSDEAWATREMLIRNVALSQGFDVIMSSPIGQNFSGSFLEFTARVRNEPEDGAAN